MKNIINFSVVVIFGISSTYLLSCETSETTLGVGGTANVSIPKTCPNLNEKPCPAEVFTTGNVLSCVPSTVDNGCYIANNCNPCPIVQHTIKTFCDFETSLECQYECEVSWGNCDNDWTTGCETDLTKPENCGACENLCEKETEKRQTGECGLNPTNSVSYYCLCGGAYNDCDQDQSNGCEKDFWNDMSCGGCDIVCPMDQYCMFGICVPK